jgi:hypothetical protein
MPIWMISAGSTPLRMSRSLAVRTATATRARQGYGGPWWLGRRWRPRLLGGGLLLFGLLSWVSILPIVHTLRGCGWDGKQKDQKARDQPSLMRIV